MQLQLLFIFPIILCSFTVAIKVPVDTKEENSTDEESINASKRDQNTPIYYVSDESNLDSYLIPPDPHRTEEIPPDVVTPASYLLPPTPQKHADYYYNPTEPGEQTDWYPIAQALPPQKKLQTIPIFELRPNESEAYVLENSRRGKAHESDRNILPIPSVLLEPPSVSAPDDYVKSTSEQLNLQSEELNQPINVSPETNYGPFLGDPKPLEPTLALHLIPPQPQQLNYKLATKLYPKKFTGFKPVSIPIAQFADEPLLEAPKAKPVKYFKPISGTEIDYLNPSEEKVNYLYRIAEEKRKLKEQEIGQEPQQADVASEQTYGKPIPTEQETSETNYRHPGRNVHPAPLRQAPAAPAPGERTEFRMHGLKGPHSYQFGYDTGKGKNRQFRYEERDNDGQVRGHYGYMDKHGKLRVVNYSAHPELGFHAEAPIETK